MKAKEIFGTHRKGLSLMELFIAMMIVAILTSFIAPNVASQRQTAKQEAERLAAFLTGLVRKSDRRHMDLTIKFETNKVTCNSDEFILTQGFSVSQNFSGNQVVYYSNENVFESKGKLTIVSPYDEMPHYVHIRLDGRVRASDFEDEEPDEDD